MSITEAIARAEASDCSSAGRLVLFRRADGSCRHPGNPPAGAHQPWRWVVRFLLAA